MTLVCDLVPKVSEGYLITKHMMVTADSLSI